MTDGQEWQPQEGGLSLKADLYDRNNPEHRALAHRAMSDVVNTVSSAHGATADKNGLLRNLRLLNNSDENDPDIILEFYLAKWEACEAKPKVLTASNEPKADDAVLVGAATGWFTYYYDENGKLHRAHQLEDFALFRNGIRTLFRTIPDGAEMPEESLAALYDQISLEQMHKKYGVDYKLGEVAFDNIAMMRQMKRNGADMREGQDSAILEFERMPSGLLDPFPETVKVLPIRYKGRKSKRSFTVRWKDGDHDVRFVVTKGQATTAGAPRIDIHPWDNGNPPDPYILKSIVAATLQAIEEEADKRKWGLNNGIYIPSPIIPLLESRHDIYKALFGASAERIVIPHADASNSFCAPTPPIHIHIIGKPHMIKAFKDVHAEQRFFAGKPMAPGVNAAKAGMHLIS